MSKSNIRRNAARPESKTGLKGAHSDGGGKYFSRITIEGERVYLGHFDTPEAASEAYIKRAKDEGLLTK